MLRQLLFIANFILLPLFLLAQNNISFEATTNAKKVVTGNVFDVSFTVKNARGTNFIPPKFGGFQVISGPSSSMSTQIINGKMTQEMSYSYTLMPDRVGNWTIGPATIDINGKTYKSTPIQMQVVKGQETSALAGTDKECFIRAEPSTKNAYIGQQILLDYKLYTTVNIDNYSTLNDPEFQGFYAQDIRRFNNPIAQEVVNGIQYTTKILKRVAIFPQQAGILTIEPLNMQLGIEIPGQQSTGFFFRKKTRPVQTATNLVEINVRNLPPNAPVSFNGAVGEYSLQANVKPTSVTTDDAITVLMRLSGNGDLKRLQPPVLVVPDKMEVYDPSILDESSQESQGEITGTKTLEYLVLPKEAGQYLIVPEFTYFSPDSAKYVTLKSSPTRVNVGRGTGNSNVNAAPKKEAQTDIRFIKLETSLHEKGGAFFGSFIFWLLGILPILVLLGVFIYRQILNKKGDMDLTLLKSNQAGKIAQKRLSTAKKHLDANDSRAFYDEISRASLGYVGDKLNIPNSEMTKNNVREKLQALQVSKPNIEAFMKILQTSEMALFAGMDNSAAMSETYEKAMNVVVNIEEEIG